MTDEARRKLIREHLENFTPIPVTYSVTLPGRTDPVLDSKGEPVTTKSGKARTKPVKLPVPANIYEGTYDQWRDLYDALGLDPDEQFAHFVNAAFKQGNESLKGDLRDIVKKEAASVKSKSNKAALEIVGKRDKVTKALKEFATACTENIPTKPVKVESEKKRALAQVEAIEAMAPGITAQLAQMTPEQIRAALAAAAKEGESTDD